MKARRWIWTILSIVIALSLIAAVPASKKVVFIRAGDSRDVNVGVMGVHVTDSYYTGDLTVTRKTVQPVTGKDRIKLLEKMIDMRFMGYDGMKVTHIQGSWYVFYNLTPKEKKLFNEGKIAIFYFDSWPKKWKQCYTFVATGQSNRITCRMLNFGLYGLAYR
jgi:hypothetical protein